MVEPRYRPVIEHLLILECRASAKKPALMMLSKNRHCFRADVTAVRYLNVLTLTRQLTLTRSRGANDANPRKRHADRLQARSRNSDRTWIRDCPSQALALL
jgi:hypothetical protein